MQSVMSLAWRGLARAPARTALVFVGLSVTGALLLDMTMLAGGLEASLGAVLSRLGFAVRVVPRGTMPFSGDAEITDGDRLAAAIATRPDVTAAVPVVGVAIRCVFLVLRICGGFCYSAIVCVRFFYCES